MHRSVKWIANAITTKRQSFSTLDEKEHTMIKLYMSNLIMVKLYLFFGNFSGFSYTSISSIIGGFKDYNIIYYR
jgi:hypothetical protein